MLYGLPFSEEEIKPEETVVHKPVPYIRMDGPPHETIYQNTLYSDPGAEVMDVVNGEIRCSGIFLKSSGNLNIHVPGIYLMEYKAEDSQGNVLPVVTRTIQVVVNDAAFLNGIYNVACSCTAVIGSSPALITTEDYIAAVSSGSKNREFELNKLKIGPVDIIPSTRLNEDRIEVSYFYEDIDIVRSQASGTLSPSKNTFTIESHAVKTYPYKNYHCINVFRNTKWRYDSN